MAKPTVFEYIDFRAFMRAFYNHKKESTPGFSFATWNEKSGFKSRSFLRLIMLSQRELGLESIPRVAAALELGRGEQRYFELLVQLSKAKTIDEREMALQRVLRHSRSGQLEKIKNSYVFLSNHNAPKVLSYLMMQDLERSPQKIASSLGLNIEDVRGILQSFLKLGLAEENIETGQWQPFVTKVDVPDELGNLALQSFHSRSLEEAKQAIARAPEGRHFESLTLTLTSDEYTDCVEQIKSFTEFLLTRFETQEGHDRKIHQINFQVIPVSERLIRSEHTSEKSETERAQEPSYPADEIVDQEVFQ